MKKTIIIPFLLLTAVLFTACTKNEVSTTTQENGQTQTPPTEKKNVGQNPGQNGPQADPGGMNLASAAATLKISEEKLKQALDSANSQGRPDFASVAKKLGVTEEALMKALGMSQGQPGKQGIPNGQKPTQSK